MPKKILFVDADASLRQTMALGLSQYGYETEFCENGISALKKLESYVNNNVILDAAVVDLRLPDIDGLKLVKIINFKYPGIPVIIMIGFADKFDRDEIKNLKTSAFLVKPFTLDDLNDQLEKTWKKHPPTIQPEPGEKKPGSKNPSAYMILRVDDSDFFEIHKALYYMDNVVFCDATKGDYDIFLLAQADSIDKLKEMSEKIKAMKGIKSVDFLEVSTPALDESTASIIGTAEDAFSRESGVEHKNQCLSQWVCSYLLLDVDREKLDKIYPALRLDKNVIFCDYTTGKYNLVLFVSGSYFEQIDRFVQEKIINLDGVLKVKEYPIISIYEM